MADAEQYRQWAGQQVDTRTRDAMLDEADRIDRRESNRAGVVQVNITIQGN